MLFELALNKIFYFIQPPLIYRRFKHRKRTKINKTILSVSPSSVYIPIHSLGITLKIFQLPDSAQVLQNLAPITQSSINPQENKINPHTIYATSLAVGLRGSFQTFGVTKGNLGLISLSHFT